MAKGEEYLNGETDKKGERRKKRGGFIAGVYSLGRRILSPII